jgi:ABC-type spermidine/putrescine transport system permease subunit I
MKTNRLLVTLIGALPVIFVAIFVGFPIVIAIAYTLGFTGGPNATIASLDLHKVTAKNGMATFEAYQMLMHDKGFLGDFWATIWVTVVSVLFIIVVGWTLALYIRFGRGWFVAVVSSLYVVPLFIPGVIAAYAIVTFWNANGWLAALIEKFGLHFPGFGYTLGGVVLGQLWLNIPFAVLMIASGLQSVPDTLIESARDVGASIPRILFKVILPLNIVPTVIVCTFTGIGILGSFTIPYLVGPTAPTLLGVSMGNYFTSYRQPQQAMVMAVIVFLLALVLGIIYVWVNVRGEKKAGTVQ